MTEAKISGFQESSISEVDTNNLAELRFDKVKAALDDEINGGNSRRGNLGDFFRVSSDFLKDDKWESRLNTLFRAMESRLDSKTNEFVTGKYKSYEFSYNNPLEASIFSLIREGDALELQTVFNDVFYEMYQKEIVKIDSQIEEIKKKLKDSKLVEDKNSLAENNPFIVSGGSHNTEFLNKSLESLQERRKYLVDLQNKVSSRVQSWAENLYNHYKDKITQVS